MSKFFPIFSLAVGMAVALSGCGSKDSDSATFTAP